MSAHLAERASSDLAAVNGFPGPARHLDGAAELKQRSTPPRTEPMMGLSGVVEFARTNVIPDRSCRSSKRMPDAGSVAAGGRVAASPAPPATPRGRQSGART